MALGRYLVEAVVLERRSVSELARRHGVSRYWIYKLLKRFHEGGFAALEPRSRRPKTCAHETAASVQAEILQLRQELSEAGHDAGPQTIAHHLIGRAEPVPSAATIWRILKRHGVVTPQPHKRPRCSFIRFEAKLPNETWQCDATAWQLADGSPVEILNIEDDHSRLFVHSSAFHTLKAGEVVEAFFAAADSHGLPASFLTDNAAVFSGGSRRGKVPLELELERLGIEVKHSTPYHPQTCGKVERLHQTLNAIFESRPPPHPSPTSSSSSTPFASTTRNAWTTSSALTVGKAVEFNKSREWSPSMFRISTEVPSASCQGVASHCQVWLGSWASKRTQEQRGRLWLGLRVVSRVVV